MKCKYCDSETKVHYGWCTRPKEKLKETGI